VSMSSGSDHLLAVTSHGRAFSMPTSWQGNAHGQLGYRRAFVGQQTSEANTKAVELNPILTEDSLRATTPFTRRLKDNDNHSSDGALLSELEQTERERYFQDDSARFSTRLQEIPALRGLAVDQIACGERSSYALTEGKVLAWGANEFGLSYSLRFPTLNVKAALQAVGLGSKCYATLRDSTFRIIAFLCNSFRHINVLYFD